MITGRLSLGRERMRSGEEVPPTRLRPRRSGRLGVSARRADVGNLRLAMEIAVALKHQCLISRASLKPVRHGGLGSAMMWAWE
jgi:hypothetical protein